MKIRSIQGEKDTIFLQPVAVFPVIGFDHLNCLPESLTVIVMFKMSQFVQNDIIDHTHGCHAKTVGEVEVVLAGAASPTGFCAGDTHLVDLKVVFLLIVSDQIYRDRSGFFSIPGDEGFFCSLLD